MYNVCIIYRLLQTFFIYWGLSTKEIGFLFQMPCGSFYVLNTAKKDGQLFYYTYSKNSNNGKRLGIY